MKILSPEQLHKADQKTIKNEDIVSWQLMEHASLKAIEILTKIILEKTVIQILAGSGNNGGDGLAIAYHLQKIGYTVEVLLVEYASKLSPDNQQNLDRLLSDNLVKVSRVDKNTKGFNFKPQPVIIDAIFGIGLNRDLPAFVNDIIITANESDALRLAVDVPSGMFLNDLTPEHAKVFQAHHTLTFQCPKLNFFLPNRGNSLGKIWVIDIGLDQDYISTLENPYEYLDSSMALSLKKTRKRFSHKGDYGHLLVIGGQYGMMGSVCLTSKAALKSGAGKVTVLSPKCGVEIIQQYVPEAMVIPSKNQEQVSSVELNFKPSHICMGMGLGQSEQALETLKYFIDVANSPMLIDADGLNLLAQHNNLLEKLPPKTILTPHQGELKRLVGEWEDDYDKLTKMKNLVKTYDVILVSKDAYTFIVSKDKIYINSTGNAGMATAGSGDTLSGIISGLLAQKYAPLEASILGVYLHGLAADTFIEKHEEYSLIASDIIDCLGDLGRLSAI